MKQGLKLYKYLIEETDGSVEENHIPVFVLGKDKAHADRQARKVERSWYNGAVKLPEGGYMIPFGVKWKLVETDSKPALMICVPDGMPSNSYGGFVVARPLNESGEYADTLLQLNGQEADTVLAALRFYQQYGLKDRGALPAAIQDIAAEHGKPLTAKQIDALCETINTAE
jgi:hypothetical protein